MAITVVNEPSKLNDMEHMAFVLNPSIIIAEELPYEIIPNCYIDKATNSQRDRIRKALSSLVIGHPMMTPPEHYYESKIIYENSAHGKSWRYEELPESEWHYYIVTTQDGGHTARDLHLAANISNAPLDLTGLAFPKMGVSFNNGVFHNYFDLGPEHTPIRVGRELLQEISEIYFAYKKATTGLDGPKFLEIQRAMGMFDSLRLLPINSEFHILGLFSIIELLITHNPKLEDRGDSITHQMQTKLPLLFRRFANPLDFHCYFEEAAEKKIWGALYKYRSALAHGGSPDFQSELQILKNGNNVKNFLSEVVKALIRQCVKEPQLFRDLREC